MALNHSCGRYCASVMMLGSDSKVEMLTVFINIGPNFCMILASFHRDDISFIVFLRIFLLQ